jgi:predicted TIM-barrel fold metal-dependent hydrolase
MRVDAFAHCLPLELHGRLVRELGGSRPEIGHWKRVTTLHDIDLRLAMMDEAGLDQQILTTAGPPLESLFDDGQALEFAKVANETMAQLVAAFPDRFQGVATIPLVDVDWAIAELSRAVRDLGLVGVLLYTSVRGRPLDAPELEPFYSTVEELDVPIWLHPDRPRRHPDYPGETGSRYGLFLVLGWPYETSVAMARLVFGGVLGQHPRLRIIVHHAGAMIPFFAKRIELHFAEGEELEWPDVEANPDVAYMDQFRRFYVDTVVQGSVSALMNAYELFGADHMLLGTDMPFGPRLGRVFACAAVESVEAMPISDAEKDMISCDNALRLCRL